MTQTEQALSNLTAAVAEDEGIVKQFTALAETVAAELSSLVNNNALDATIGAAINKQVDMLTAGTAIAKKALVDLGVAEAGALTITSLDPAIVKVNSSDMTIKVIGTGFVSNESMIHINGVPVSTTFISKTVLNASLPAGFFIGAGIDKLTVMDPDFPSKESNELDITVV